MKRFLIILLSLILFCSCTPSAEPEQMIPEEIESTVPSVSEPVQSQAAVSDAYLEAEYKLIEYSENNHLLENYGITARAEDVLINGDGTLSFSLLLEKDKKDISMTVNGFWYWYNDGYSTKAYRANLNWGGYSFIGDDFLAVCSVNKVRIIDLKDFSLLDINFDFPDNGELDYWVNGAVFDEQLGWIISAAEASYGTKHDTELPWKIMVFDKDGSFLKTLPTNAIAQYGGWLDYATPNVARNCAVFNAFGNKYLYFDTQAYCVNNQKTFSTYKQYYENELISGGYNLSFYSVYDIDGYRPWDPYSDKTRLGYFAVLKTIGGELVEILPTDDDIVFDTWDENGIPDLRFKHNGELSFTIENGNGKSMTIDFKNGGYSVEYNLKEKHLEEVIDYSPDGKYSLWQAAVEAGGEAYNYDVALRNNQTGEIRRIDSNGTSIGQDASEGFLKNGDFYIFSSSGFKIYSAESAEVIFDISQNFSNDAKGEKLIHTFRRDPNDFSFIVVYSDISGFGDEGIQKGYDDGVMPFTIKLAYLDKEGRILEDFDSGVFVTASYFGMQLAEMKYSPDEIILFSDISGKGYAPFRIVFDPKTKTFL